MNANDERRELVPVTIAAIVLVIGIFFMWSDLRDDTLAHGDDVITSAVVSRAGATLIIPGQPPSHLVVPQTMPASESSTVGRAVH
jgi:hypothetical protein